MNNQGDYASLARLAREKREQSEYVDELRTVLALCHTAQKLLRTVTPIGNGPRHKISAHIFDAVYLARQELKRLGVEG